MSRQLVTLDRARGCLVLASCSNDVAYAHIMSRNQQGRHRTVACLYSPAAEWRVDQSIADDGVSSDFTLHMGRTGVVPLMGACEAERVQKFIDSLKPVVPSPASREVSHAPT